MRLDGRKPDQLRSLTLIPGFISSADGSVLIQCGQTRVICTAMVEEKVPPFLEGKDQGWVTAEYAMLPGSTRTRKARGGSKPDGRGVEIQRLIGRSLRAAVDLQKLGPRTITLDCDVIEADGGTRTASISGAYVALALCCDKLLRQGLVRENPVIHQVAAVSVGKVEDIAVLDLNYPEDARAQVDMNVVMNERGDFIELQGTGEHDTFNEADLQAFLRLAKLGIKEIMAAQTAACTETNAQEG
ncbi:Ribonuclease PH [uncultured Clostridium sp.]|nr:Ribonuclease PH [uncultured Clostridium sp.]